MKAQSFKSKSKAFFCVLMTLFLFACGGGGGSEVVAPPSTGDISTGGGAGTPVGVISASGFWIDSRNPEFPTYVNSADGFGTDCIIEPDAPLGRIDCYIDIMELDLYNNSLKIQYNVPPDMCQHLGITPSWHWNYSPGVGPTSVTIQSTIDSVTSEEGLDTCTASRDDGGDTNCLPSTGTHPEILDIDESGIPVCAYDHSRLSDTAPNCCFGEYTLRKETDTTDDGFYDTTTTEIANWGGDVGQCIGGPVRNGLGTLDTDGFPVEEITQIPADGGTGLNAEIDIAANSQGPKVTYSYPANFYTTVGAPHSHTGFNSATVSNLPYAFDPIDDLDGTPLRPTNASYRFACLDEADDIKYEIHVYVREWNTVTEFLAYGTSEGASYNPDVGGFEGSSCPGVGGDECNDYDDMDDILSLTGGTYDTGPTVDHTQRNTYFPRISY